MIVVGCRRLRPQCRLLGPQARRDHPLLHGRAHRHPGPERVPARGARAWAAGPSSTTPRPCSRPPNQGALRTGVVLGVLGLRYQDDYSHPRSTPCGSGWGSTRSTTSPRAASRSSREGCVGSRVVRPCYAARRARLRAGAWSAATARSGCRVGAKQSGGLDVALRRRTPLGTRRWICAVRGWSASSRPGRGRAGGSRAVTVDGLRGEDPLARGDRRRAGRSTRRRS